MTSLSLSQGVLVYRICWKFLPLHNSVTIQAGCFIIWVTILEKYHVTKLLYKKLLRKEIAQSYSRNSAHLSTEFYETHFLVLSWIPWILHLLVVRLSSTTSVIVTDSTRNALITSYSVFSTYCCTSDWKKNIFSGDR